MTSAGFEDGVRGHLSARGGHGLGDQAVVVHLRSGLLSSLLNELTCVGEVER